MNGRYRYCPDRSPQDGAGRIRQRDYSTSPRRGVFRGKVKPIDESYLNGIIMVSSLERRSSCLVCSSKTYLKIFVKN
jgi:hypothetical protein